MGQVNTLIFGVLGWEFLEYLLGDIQLNLVTFKKQLKLFDKNHEPSRIKSSTLDKRWSCRDAHALIVDWQTAQTAIELAYDFLDTNRGTMGHYRTTWRTVMHIPVHHSYQYRIYKNMVAADMAREFVRGSDEFTVNDIKAQRRWPRPNLGLFAFQMFEMRVQRTRLEEFVKLNQCHKYL